MTAKKGKSSEQKTINGQDSDIELEFLNAIADLIKGHGSTVPLESLTTIMKHQAKTITYVWFDAEVDFDTLVSRVLEIKNKASMNVPSSQIPVYKVHLSIFTNEIAERMGKLRILSFNDLATLNGVLRRWRRYILKEPITPDKAISKLTGFTATFWTTIRSHLVSYCMQGGLSEAELLDLFADLGNKLGANIVEQVKVYVEDIWGQVAHNA